MVLLPCYHSNVTSLTSFYTLFRYDCNVILLYCVTSVAVYLAIIPVCHVFGIMLAFFALLGVHMGIIDTVANSILIKIHGKKVRVLCMERIHSRGQNLCKCMGKTEIFYIKKEFNSHRTGLGRQHGRRFIVLGHKYGRRDVMWIRSICRLGKDKQNAKAREKGWKWLHWSSRFQQSDRVIRELLATTTATATRTAKKR